jgi:hypothetical protein
MEMLDQRSATQANNKRSKAEYLILEEEMTRKMIERMSRSQD